MKRRDLFAASLAAGMMGVARRGWSATPDGTAPQAAAALGRTALHGTIPRLVPIRAHADQIMDIKVCLRPFRPAGPRMDVEHVAGKTVVHNYGHGGSAGHSPGGQHIWRSGMRRQHWSAELRLLAVVLSA
ncbi:hypothetical protein [Acetobacter okinawensis]|uniref:hypothetical protein n=1 Tax=Acetobacter okinawensis TaxID=1076594 RepID=UPI001F5636F8|nr:hypothetical protein [Acetobacter okinawensis]